MRRPLLPAPLAALGSAALLLAVAGCASVSGPRDHRLSPADPGVVTSRQIEESGARTVWEALRLSVSLRMSDDEFGQPAALLHRGHTSIVGEPTPLLVVDGALVRDIRQLDAMPAEDLLSIHVRSSSYAVARYGSLAGAGVIELTMRGN